MKSNKLQKLTGIFYFIKGILGVAVSVFFTFGGGVLSIVGCTMINDVNQSET